MEPKFAGKSRITQSGQLTVPKEARQGLKIGANSELFIYTLDDALIAVKEIVNPKELVKKIIRKK